MKRIQKLSPQLINQIAAGEVIERPASVVKELVENSLDAKASQIEINIQQGGYDLIQVRDNGCGIVKEDLPLAVASHATSKIDHFEQLSALNSLGFRGEALASISSISRFCVQSRAVGEELAWQIQANGQKIPRRLEPVAHTQGTTIIVRELFYNTPVRRKFLRLEKTEFEHIESIVKRLALSFDAAHWHLQHNGKTVLNLSPATDKVTREKRVLRIFGKNFLENAVFIDHSAAGMHLYGWIGLPSFMRSQNDLQYFYLNGRIVRDKVIGHAIRQAYEQVLYPGRQPAYLLYLTLDPSSIDVNVHPTKYEVRFYETRTVHDFILSVLNSVLSRQTDYCIAPEQTQKMQVAESFGPYGENRTTVSKTIDGNLPLCQIANRYIVVQENHDRLVIYDSCCAQSVLDYHDMKEQFAQGELITRPLLVSVTLSLPAVMWNVLKKYTDHLQRLAWSFSTDSERVIKILTFPACLTQADLPKALLALLDYLQQQVTVELSEKNWHQLLEIMAEHNAVAQCLSIEAMRSLLRKLKHLSMSVQELRQAGIVRCIESEDLLTLFE